MPIMGRGLSYSRYELRDYVKTHGPGWHRNEALRAYRKLYPDLVEVLCKMYDVKLDEYTDMWNPDRN